MQQARPRAPPRRHPADALSQPLFAGQLGAMPPDSLADGGSLVVVRPLVYCAEEDIRAFSELAQFPILPCDLCGSQENSQRKAMARMLDQLERDQIPGTKTVMLSALQNVRPSHLLDQRLWRSLGLAGLAGLEEGGDDPLSPASRPHPAAAARPRLSGQALACAPPPSSSDCRQGARRSRSPSRAPTRGP